MANVIVTRSADLLCYKKVITLHIQDKDDKIFIIDINDHDLCGELNEKNIVELIEFLNEALR